MEALCLQQKELDALLAELVGEEKVSLSRHRRRETTLQSRSKIHRSEGSQ